MVAMEPWHVAELAALIRRAAPFGELPSSALDAVLDMLAGRYPSTAFAELRPRLVWDRVTDMLTARPGAQRLAVTSGGTIPDRGLFGVFLAGAERGGRVGELDEEMVYESRVGDVFLLGSTSWRIEDITPDRVLVSPAPGASARMPFWKGDALGRPVELGRAIGAQLRTLTTATPDAARASLTATGLDTWAVDNLLAYVGEQRDATRVLPDDRTVLVERFRDELGDWRMTVHCVLGARVNGPWALAIARRIAERYGVDSQVMPSDDGIVIRLPDVVDEPPGADLVAFDPDEIATIVEESVGTSALFASRFRECAARALLLPRRDPNRRTPLWQQRQRAAQLLDVARDFPDFPITLEAARECLRDVFDVPGLVELMRDLGGRRVRLVDVETPKPSPFARSLLFGYVGAFLYEGDAPLAERRAAALALDSTLLGELLGRVDLRELLDPAVVTETERRLQWLDVTRPPRDAEDAAEMLRRIGDLSVADAAIRGIDPSWLAATRRHPSGDRGPHRRRAAVDRDRGRRPDARRARRRAAGRHRRGVHGTGGRSARRSRRSLCPHARAVHRGRLRRPVRPRCVRRRAGAAPAGRRRPSRLRRVHPGRRRHRVLRRRGPAHAAPPVARRAAQGDRAGAAGRAGPVPAGLAADRLARPWRRRTRAHDRDAARRQRAGLGARTARAAGPGRRLRARVPRRVVRDRRGGLGRPRFDRIERRLDPAGVRRPRTAAPAAAGRRSGGRTAAPGGARVPRPRPGAVLPRSLRPGHGPLDADGRPDAGDGDIAAAIWDLVWAGYLSNDTLAPLRALQTGGSGAHRAKATPSRTRLRRPGTSGYRFDIGRSRAAGAGAAPASAASAASTRPGRRHRPWAAGGIACRSSTSIRPVARRRPPTRCSTGTAWSPAEPCSRRT